MAAPHRSVLTLALVLTLLLAACGGGGTAPPAAQPDSPSSSEPTAAPVASEPTQATAPTSAPQPTAAPAAEEPVRLIVAIPTDKPTLDAHVSQTDGNDYGTILYDRLVDFDENTQIIPQLATSWSVSDDGLTWTFELREGHTFHDGTPVNAESVKASFERFLDPANSDLFLQRAGLEPVTQIEAIGPYSLAFTTEYPYPVLLNKLAIPSGGIVSPTAATAVTPQEFGLNPVGSGPYRFVEWVPNTRIVFEKNPDHWLANSSNVDIIEFRPIPDVSTRAIALETGEVHFATITDPTEAARLDEVPGLRAYNLPLARNLSIVTNLLKEPFDDIRVRQAIAHAVDRELIVDSFYSGFATVPDTVLNAGLWSYKAQPEIPYDPERARELLAEAGYPDGFTTTLRVPTGRIGGIQQTAQAVAAMLADVGITAELDLMEHVAWVSSMRKAPEESDYLMSFWTWGTDTGEPDYNLNLQFNQERWSPTCCNRMFYANDEVTEALIAAQREVDEDRRRQLYERVQELVWQDLPQFPLVNLNHTAVGRENVTGIRILPVERFDFRQVTINE
ncbi:MAG TPA: ABC transporter substrate-binding protein [Chloroflexaceae bacterium]|nr:ABC transporter substrate-binding protein [Chloroflexaceae bacterium]